MWEKDKNNGGGLSFIYIYNHLRIIMECTLVIKLIFELKIYDNLASI